MSALFGTQGEEDYIQVGTVKLPLPRNPEGRMEEWEVLRSTPLEPFQASTVLGDASLISDDRIAQAVFSDFRPGMGKRRYTPTESLSGYQDGDLLTVEGVATLPPLTLTLTTGTLPTLAASPVAPALCCTGFGFDLAARYQFALWTANSSRIYIWDNNTASWLTGVGLANLGSPYTAMAYFANRYVCCQSFGGIYHSTDGNTWTLSWNPAATVATYTPEGLIAHDNKLYAVIRDTNTNGVKLFWVATQAQLTAGVVWPASSTDTFFLDIGELVTNVVDWKDIRGNRQIFIGTNKRIFAYDDADFFAPFAPIPNYKSTYRPFLFVSPRDDLLYVCFGGANDSVFVYNHQTIEETGPNKEFGIPVDGSNFAIVLLAGNSRHMFAFGAASETGGTQGHVLIANDAFGWSHFARGRHANNDVLNEAPTAGQIITGGFYFSGRLYIVRSGGTVEYIDWPDKAMSVYTLQPSAPNGRPYAAGIWWQYSPEFDTGNELLQKLAKWWTIHLEDPSNASGPQLVLPANCHLFFKYQFDGGSWTTYGPSIGPLDPFPYRIPLPSVGVQTGTVFRKLRFAVGLQNAAVGTNYITPVLRAVILAYTREPDIYDGLQVVVDLSQQRFDQLDGQLFYGNDRQYLRNYIETLKSGPLIVKTHYPVTFGFGGNVRSYASMDVRISGTEDPSDAYGHYTLTLRDVTAPSSG